MPEFPGGIEGMYRFLQQNFRMPLQDMRKGVVGTVVVRMVVDPTGQVGDVKILKSLTPTIDQEAVRVINTMPLWKPGNLDGKPVSVQYTIPYRISIK